MDSGGDVSDDDQGALSSKSWQAQDMASPDGSTKSSTDQSPIKTEGFDGMGGEASGSSSMPTQKRRRVTRACDECRRKKIKCDGKQPCTHCCVYSYGRSTLDCGPGPYPDLNSNPYPDLDAIPPRLNPTPNLTLNPLFMPGAAEGGRP